MLISPYIKDSESSWLAITNRLVQEFPISSSNLILIVETAWNDFYGSRIGAAELIIGQDLFLPAQATGVILERLISFHLSNKFPNWRGGNRKIEKDIVCNYNDLFSFEIKTSSSKTGLFGNRSTGHRSKSRTKYRSGYYLVVNYKLPTEDDMSKHIWKIRFGWIDDEDWVGQKEPTGQQASIGVELAKLKLVTLKENI